MRIDRRGVIFVLYDRRIRYCLWVAHRGNLDGIVGLYHPKQLTIRIRVIDTDERSPVSGEARFRSFAATG